MTYNARRCETLQRLGIEQLPTLYSEQNAHRAKYAESNEMITPLGGILPVRTRPVSNLCQRPSLHNVQLKLTADPGPR